MRDSSIAVMGPNGAGKSTLLRLLARVERPTSGSLSFGDGASARGSQPAYLPQAFSAPPGLSVAQMVELAGWLKGVRDPAAGAKRAIAAVGLTDNANDQASRLSGGMLRRAGVACAIVDNPTLLVLDEPTAGLDAESRTQLARIISRIAEESTVVFSTHLIDDVLETGASCLALAEGTLNFFEGGPVTDGQILSAAARGHAREQAESAA